MPPRKGSHRKVLETISLLLKTMKSNSWARSHGLARMPPRKGSHREVLETISLLLETMKPNSGARSHGLARMPPRKGSHREVLETISLLLETMKPNSGARSRGLALMPHRKVPARWCGWQDSNLHGLFKPLDFKSNASTIPPHPRVCLWVQTLQKFCFFARTR